MLIARAGGALAALLVVHSLLGCAAKGEADPPDPPAFPSHRQVFPVGSRTLAYVTNGGSDTVSVVDLDAMTTLGSGPVGLDPVDPDGPADLVIDRGSGTLFVTLSYPLPALEGPHAAHHALPRPGYVAAFGLEDLRLEGALAVDPSPEGLALAADGNTLLVVHDDVDLAAQLTSDIASRRAALWVISPARGLTNGTANGRPVSVCAAPYAVAYGADDSRAFVTCTGEDSLAVVDPEAFSVLERVPVTVPQGGVSKPYAAVSDPSHTELAVSSIVSRSVSLFGMGDASLVWTSVFDGTSASIPSGVPYFAAWLPDSTLLVPLQSPDGAALLDARTGAVLRTVTYGTNDCEAPRQAVVTDDARLLLLCAGDGFDPGAVVALDPSTLAVTARANVELAPDRMAVLSP